MLVFVTQLASNDRDSVEIKMKLCYSFTPGIYMWILAELIYEFQVVYRLRVFFIEFLAS